MHHDRVSLIRSAKATRLWEHGNDAGGARLFFECKAECKSLDATFWVSTIVHPYDMERVAATPNKYTHQLPKPYSIWRAFVGFTNGWREVKLSCKVKGPISGLRSQKRFSTCTDL